MKRLNIAIIGQGRSGRGIHGSYFLTDKGKELYHVAAVVEWDEARRKRAAEEFSCEVYEDYRALLTRSDIDLVLNASFSHLHFPITLDLLNHGFHTVVEKPFSRYAADCEQMIHAAQANRVMLSVFQQSRFAPYYKRIKEIIADGALGEIHQIHICFSGYSRRWDWQCAKKYYGGALLNTGPHPLDQALDLLETDEMPQIFSALKKINSAGDAEDYAKVIFTLPGKPLVEVEVNCADAYCDSNYKISGSRGSLKATLQELEYKYFDAAPLPELELEPLRGEDGIAPAYCKDDLTWHEFREKFDGTAFDVGTAGYYQNIYNHLTAGEELVIRPEKILQQIRVAELVHAQNPSPTQF